MIVDLDEDYSIPALEEKNWKQEVSADACEFEVWRRPDGSRVKIVQLEDGMGEVTEI